MQLLLKLEDNRLIETVGIPVEDDKGSVRLTACVSSQVFHLTPESSNNVILLCCNICIVDLETDFCLCENRC